MSRSIDLNADLGEGYGPWTMGDDAGLLGIVASANVACGGHAGDPETMYETLRLAVARQVVVGAHPGYADPLHFGRRPLPLTVGEVERLIAAQVGALQGVASLAGTRVAYVKPHGALANVAAADAAVARAVATAVRALPGQLELLVLAGSELERAGRAAGLVVRREIYADRAYLASGQLVPRSAAGAVLHDATAAVERLAGYLASGRMPVVDGEPIALEADSICVHGDGPGAVALAAAVRRGILAAGWVVAPFAGASR